MSRPGRHSRPHAPSARRGFTITELLVVIAIVILLVAIAVPALTALVASSRRSLAENQLRAGLTAGRDAAIQSGGADGAAVFHYDLSGQVRIVPCVMVGRLPADEPMLEGDPAVGLNSIDRDVFVPVANVEAIQLPRGWGVRAYVPPSSIDPDTSESAGWYEGLTGRADVGNWVFPETGFINPAPGATPTADPAFGGKGGFRQTFMVRFEAGSGAFKPAGGSLAIVIDPIAVEAFRTSAPWKTARIDQAEDTGQFVRRLLARPKVAHADLLKLIGSRSIDAVLAGPVAELALYDESRMIAAIGARGPNRATRTIYGNNDPSPAKRDETPVAPTIDTYLFTEGTLSADEINRRVAQWIEGRYTPDGATGPVASDARIFTLQTYLGQVQELEP